MATSGDVVDEETHSFPCLCSWKQSLEEPAPIQEEPLGEHLRRLLYLSVEPLLIKKGDHVDLQKLLFTQERDFLMKSNGQEVEMDGLRNKYVLLYIFPLVDNYKIPIMTRELVELRNLLQDKGCFEIVFVGLGSTDLSKQRMYFEDYSSQMTWPFIPHEDHDARERVRSTFGFSQRFVADNGDNHPYCGIVDPTGKVLQSWAWFILNYYGHDAFTFTDEKIFSLYKEEASIFARYVSLEALLGTSNRDYVLSPNGDKDDDALVLYNKRLLVLFGTHSCCDLGDFLFDLKLLYKWRKGTAAEFEVIYISFDCQRSDFDESTSRMPWIVFPFRRKWRTS